MMSAIHKQIQQWAQAGWATHACGIDREEFKTFDYVRASCAANACGNFGRCWTCPPDLGEQAALTGQLQSFPGGVVIQNITTLADSWDFEGMMEVARAHNRMMRELGRQLAVEYPGRHFLVLGCGGCGYCETCTCPDAPCRAPDQALASVEGYGLDVKLLVE